MAKHRKSKKSNPKSCPRGKKLVKIKGRAARSFCASTSKKKGGKRGGKKSGIAAMSTAARKAMTRKSCAKPGVAKKMPGLCKWART